LVNTKVTVQKISLAVPLTSINHNQNYLSETSQKKLFNKQHTRDGERHIRVISVHFHRVKQPKYEAERIVGYQG